MISKTAAAFLLSAVLFTSPVLALESTPSGKIPVLKPKVENRVDNIKAKIATREAALKEKLATFKDKKKAEVTERVSTNLNMINKNRTDQMLKHLGNMTVILDKLETRAGKSAAITASRVNIASASSAVRAQAQKDYTITVTSESKVKADAQKVRLQLQADLQGLRKQVIDAKQSVANAIRESKSNGSK